VADSCQEDNELSGTINAGRRAEYPLAFQESLSTTKLLIERRINAQKGRFSVFVARAGGNVVLRDTCLHRH